MTVCRQNEEATGEDLLPCSRRPSWVPLSNWPYHCSSLIKPLLLMSSYFAVQSQTLLPSCACLFAFIFPLLYFSLACRTATRQQPSSLLLPSVLRLDEVTLRYMSRFVGKTMVGFLSFFFFGVPRLRSRHRFVIIKVTGRGNGREQHRGMEARRSGDVMKGGGGADTTWAG